MDPRIDRLLPLLVLTAVSPAQWLPAPSPVLPTAARGATLVFDPVRSELLRFGGFDGVAYGAETWSCGAAWTRLAPSTSPSPRWGMELCCDVHRGVVVGFGGAFSTTVLAETWEWDGSDWRQVATATVPDRQLPGFGGPGLIRHRMVYDSDRRRVVLHGGTDWMGFAHNHLVWEYDGNDWQVAGSGGPGARRDAALVFWPTTGRTWLFGGMGAGGPADDVWCWDASAWSPVAVVGGSPGPRYDGRMVLDEARDVLVLHGGTDGNAQALDDTWDFDGVVWTPWNLPPDRRPPGPRSEAGMTWSPRHGRVVLHGGAGAFTAPLDDTWLLGAVAESFGSSCGGETLTATLRPRLGQATSLRIGGIAPAVSAAAMALGFSASWSGFGALPLPLASIGAPGCTLLTSSETLAPMASGAGVAVHVLTVPAVPALLGATVHAQGLLIDPSTNALGARTTNAVELALGR